MSRKTAVVLLLIAVLAGGCHTRPPRVDCDGHLSPINPPAPVTRAPEKHP
jgi:hypothetical protein